MADIFYLTNVEALDAQYVGNKVANLAKLLQAGFNVPMGFVIPTFVFEQWVQTGKNGVPVEFQAEIENAFEQLGGKEVAVRSSATVEDGRQASWAGQFESILAVSKENLFAAIEACWQSNFSDRSREYGDKQLRIVGNSMAVLVQIMIPAEAAGVAFSMHPVSNNHQQIYIEAVRGLGEKLVAGAVTPTAFLLAKDTMELIATTGDQLTLSGFESTSLARIVKNIETYFSYPVDVEWAKKDAQFFVLQARAITTS